MRGNAITGAGYFFRGLSMLTEPGIRGFVLIPLLANVVLFLSLGSVAYSYMDGIYQDTTESLPGWLSFLSWIIAPLFWILGGLLTGYLSTFVVLLLTSPFHSLLAEKVEERITGRQVPALEGIGAALLEIPRALVRELSKLVYYLPRALLVLVLTLIPGLNALSPVLWFLLGAWMMSLQFVDYPMDNHRLKFSDVKDACAARRISSLGFGGVVAFVSGIPLVNLIVIPAAVVGATILWCEELA
ncbi:cysteine biosynthesis protein CysZ [Luminiphilus syltensis NOR5-1B]|uniref:Cysteine biosynthesis protein CysZ n=1 Tax=Luminiphilus syltensis NOR5-1B TaxID=565045 RepID=B8KRA2_9GAMM|nr:sulfate transporter CysZ [Luminiphilus syltensis]EED34600.1 cysteine biosynthesis protein CysZ [Luminiphilus syltensis NOR5-1B]